MADEAPRESDLRFHLQDGPLDRRVGEAILRQDGVGALVDWIISRGAEGRVKVWAGWKISLVSLRRIADDLEDLVWKIFEAEKAIDPKARRNVSKRREALRHVFVVADVRIDEHQRAVFEVNADVALLCGDGDDPIEKEKEVYT